MAANPNTIPMQTVWSKEYQSTHYKIPVYPAISNYRLKANLAKGNTVKRTYARQLIANTMGGGGEFTRQTIIDTEESLVVNYEKDASFYIKNLDELQNHLPVQQKYARNSTAALHQQIDADVLGTYASFTNSLSASYFGGTSGNGIELSSGNCPQIFSAVNLLLQRANIFLNVAAKFTAIKIEDSQFDMGCAVISPDFYGRIIERLEGKVGALGDSVSVQGHVGKYMGYELFVTNALAWTGELATPTNPTDGDTITINGVVLTFKSTVDAGVTAGQVKIATTADLTRANLVAFLNAPSTTVADATNAGYNAVSATPDSSGFSDQNRLALGTWTNNNTTDLATVVFLGKGKVTVSSTFTSASNLWSSGKQIQHCLIGVMNAIDVVIQAEPSMDQRKRDGFVGYDVVTWCAYGIKVFNDSLAKMVDVRISTEFYIA